MRRPPKGRCKRVRLGNFTQDLDVKSSVPVVLANIPLKIGGATTSVTVTENAEDLLEITPEEHTDVDRSLSLAPRSRHQPKPLDQDFSKIVPISLSVEFHRLSSITLGHRSHRPMLVTYNQLPPTAL